jgi:NAD+ synthase (glutamine-hydrolysing)
MWAAMMLVFNDTGSRPGEARALTWTDIDTQKLMHDRRKTTSYMSGAPKKLTPLWRKVSVDLESTRTDLLRAYSQTPFVPTNEAERAKVCEEILNIQASGLAKRLLHTGMQKTVIGISGGLDSTLAFLVIMKAYEKLGISPENCIAITMPGFGTTGRTYQNALSLVSAYGATLREISVKDACLQHFKDIGHSPEVHDITYENTQARERTQILMDVSNKEGGLVIGTGDLSELALGRCTYNGDHMSMYAVNTSIPKTLVRYLVEYVAQQTKKSELQQTLGDILETPVSPELLPPDVAGNIQQKTEDTIGPYVLHDFFLYHFMRGGANPQKILDIAEITFKSDYDREEIRKWLKKFLSRFFSQQFKRSCLPDGPKVGSVSLSPRGDWRMPSDAQVKLWLEEVGE